MRISTFISGLHWNSLSGILAPGSYSHRTLIKDVQLPQTRVIERVRISVPWVNVYLRQNLTELLSNLSSSLPKRLDLGKRGLSATACWRQNASSIKEKGPRVGLSWNGRGSACPLLANRVLEVPFLTFTVVPRLHSFNTCILYSGMPPVAVSCDPPIHWGPSLLKLYQTSPCRSCLSRVRGWEAGDGAPSSVGTTA